MFTRTSINRIVGGACGMAAGIACGAVLDDEFLTITFGIIGGFLGMSLGALPSLVLSGCVVCFLYFV